MKLLLIVEEAGGGFARRTIERFPAEIGRDDTAAVVVNDVRASRLHARFEVSSEGLRIVDQASSNGTLVNGQAVSEALLASGDVVEVGDTKITVLAESTVPLVPRGQKSAAPASRASAAAAAPSSPTLASPEPPAEVRRSNPARWSPRMKFLSAAITVTIFAGCHFGLLMIMSRCAAPPIANQEPRPPTDTSTLDDLMKRPASGDPPEVPDQALPQKSAKAELIRRRIAGRDWTLADELLRNVEPGELDPTMFEGLAKELEANWQAAASAAIAEVRAALDAKDWVRAERGLALAETLNHAASAEPLKTLRAEWRERSATVPTPPAATAEAESRKAEQAALTATRQLLDRAEADLLAHDLVEEVWALTTSEPALKLRLRWAKALIAVRRDLGASFETSVGRSLTVDLRSGQRSEGTLEAASAVGLSLKQGDELRRVGWHQFPVPEALKRIEGLPATADRYLGRAYLHRVHGAPDEEWFDLQAVLLVPAVDEEAREAALERLAQIRRANAR